MKNIKSVIAIVLVLVQLLGSVTVFAADPYNIDARIIDKRPLDIRELEIKKEEDLASIKKQLKEQGKENMYYLFEKYIQDEFDQIIELENINSSAQMVPYSTNYTVPSNHSGAIGWGDDRTSGTVVGLSTTETSRWYIDINRFSVNQIVTYIILACMSYAGMFLDAVVCAQSFLSEYQWTQVFDGSGRAKILTIDDVLEGQATVVSDWGPNNLTLYTPYGYDILEYNYW